jgi:Zn-dependent M28 family amino/carboxypeptidase
MRKRIIWLATVLLALAMLSASPAAWAAPGDVPASQGFRKAVTLAGIREHQAALQAIADANGGNRAAGTSGYDASAEYVSKRMAAAGYQVSFQEFTFGQFREAAPPALERLTPTAKTYATPADFRAFTGSGQATGEVVPVDVLMPSTGGSTSGCEAGDFTGTAGWNAGDIALVQRGTCPYVQKAANAQAAGAAGLILYNEGNTPDRLDVPGNLPLGAEGIHIPGVGTSFAVGQEFFNLYQANPPGSVTARVETHLVEDRIPTRNVIAETPGGNPDRVVVVGAHLDSVPAGPGINDNGSGSATNLEIAEVYAAQHRQPSNQLRFIWFGAEELGLLGSAHYVESLSEAAKQDLIGMLNFDMLGSPNFVRFVYDGDGSAGLPGGAGPPGSDEIERVFLEYFAAQGLANDPTAFDGRSDYGPFIAEGIPAGGLFSGAEVPKTQAQFDRYGGLVGAQLDPCYHAACDTFAGTGDGAGATPPGLGLASLDQLSDAAAHAVLTLSKTKAL